MTNLQMGVTIALALLVLFVTTSFHYEAISFLERRISIQTGSSRRAVPLLLSGLVAAHLVEIGFYAVAFALAAGPLQLGSFSGDDQMGAFDLYYFAAETYSSLGYGDIVPNGGLRLVASIEPLNGLLLMAWSGAFLFSAVRTGQQSTE